MKNANSKETGERLNEIDGYAKQPLVLDRRFGECRVEHGVSERPRTQRPIDLAHLQVKPKVVGERRRECEIEREREHKCSTGRSDEQRHAGRRVAHVMGCALIVPTVVRCCHESAVVFDI